ncbi:type II and III secretion system protein [Arcobacter sp. LA11]|uniref:type II and III secretion system protein n=1 Tax=Arcobacter sp. LA11 TaxID=1898176 RepID=UPI001576436D|nr:type II and III secretion system protein [Arcobacter sp. LA11]
MKILNIFTLGFIISLNAIFANDEILIQSQFENKTIFIDVNSYKILQFNKRIKNIEITNSENITAELIENKENPLTRLKIYGKNSANESALIRFQDSTVITVGFNIVPHLKNIISFAENVYPDLDVEQINDTIFLKGTVQNQKDKEKILEMFKKFDVDPETKIVDMLSTSNPKMVRIKLYAVEINNSDGLTIKNNWVASSKNYTATENNYNVPLNSLYVPTTEYDIYDPLGTGTVIGKGYAPIVDASNEQYQKINNQYNELVSSKVDTIMSEALTLTGGLTGAANFLGKYFNAALTLQYLSEEGIANVLDESTLITLENKEAQFRAGGELYVRLTSDEKAELQKIDYGLELTLTAKEVMNDEFVHLNIVTKSRDLDWANAVDNIPSIINKSIETTVIIKDKATVVLGGLVNSENSKDIEKLPILGDIPILGFLFKSNIFKDGKSELVFFITPEIVKASTNDQITKFEKNKNKMFKKHKDSKKKKYLDLLNLNFSSEDTTSDEKLDKIEKTVTVKKEKPSTSKNLFKSKEPKMTPEQIHQKRVNEILGY